MSASRSDPKLHAIAEHCGVDVRTVRRWRKLPGFPADASPEEVERWVGTQGLGHKGDINELKAEKLRIDIEASRLKLQQAQGEVIPLADAQSEIRLIAQKWDLLLRLKLEVELGARCVGKSAAEINVEGSRILDEIREVCENDISRFEAKIEPRKAG